MSSPPPELAGQRGISCSTASSSTSSIPPSPTIPHRTPPTYLSSYPSVRATSPPPLPLTPPPPPSPCLAHSLALRHDPHHASRTRSPCTLRTRSPLYPRLLILTMPRALARHCTHAYTHTHARTSTCPHTRTPKRARAHTHTLYRGTSVQDACVWC